MASALLLVVIYFAFISLGLPDSLLGASWPMMHISLGFDISSLGYISLTICAGTVISSILYSKISAKARTEHITIVSVLLTALALYAFAFLSDSYTVFPIALVLGIGAGSVDAGLNYYVALHYKARHMSWLHAFWGVGTTFGPTVLAAFFSIGKRWNDAYFLMALIQSLIVIMLLLSLPLWKKNDKKSVKVEEKREKQSITLKDALMLKGALLALLSFFLYCSIEATVLNWSSSFAVFAKGLTETEGARITSFAYWGITIGRFITGLVNEKTGDRVMVASGLAVSAAGAIMLLSSSAFTSIGLSIFLIGLGFAPVYPSLLHQTLALFEPEGAKRIMGLEMASAYIGSSITPFTFGLITRIAGQSILPFALILFLSLEILVAALKRRVYAMKA